MLIQDTAAAPAPACAPLIAPHLRLYTERLLMEDPEEPSGYRDVEAAVMTLSFDYGPRRVRPREEDALEFQGGGRCTVERDLRAETRARALLESFGALELELLDHLVPPLDSQADYLVQADENVHALCSFTAHAVPRLQELGWSVELAPSYPYQVLTTDGAWFARLSIGEQQADWFSLELGVSDAGQDYDLLPALLELIDESAEGSALSELSRGTGRYRALPAGAGRYVCVEPELLERVLRVLIELYGGRRAVKADRLDFAQAADLLALEDAPGEGAPFRWQGDVRLIEQARGLARAPAPARVPSALPVTLRSYQQEGLAWLQHLQALGLGGVLADDMGLGKTLQTIAHLASEAEAGRRELPSLVIVPTSLVGNWQRELRRFAPQLKVVVLQGSRRHGERAKVPGADVVLTTYPVLVRDLELLEEQRYHYVILDEAQAIKNPRSLAKQAVSRLQARHRLCLSGTPVENDLDELWSLFDFAAPGWLGELSSFRRRFRTPIEREGNELALAQLRARVRPLVLRRTKQQVVAELPPKTHLVRPVELTGDQRELYESLRVAAHTDVRRAIRKKGFAGSAVAILDALMKLRQVCCDPRLVNAESAREVEQSAKTSAFFALTEQLLADGRRLLVFSQFTQMLALLSRGLQARGVRHLALTGATQDRQAVCDAFERGQADVFLISLKAGGTGLNLVSADTVIHFDPWWNSAAQAQATDRAYRIGQTKPVFVYDLIVAGSVEERMLALQERKRALAEGLFGEAAASGGPTLSEEDVEDLFAPLEDEV